MGLAEELTPEEPEQAEGTNSDLIRAKGTEIGTAALQTPRTRYPARWSTWKRSSPPTGARCRKRPNWPPATWSYEGKEENELIQSLATGAKKAIYEALIPMAYTQWVIAPYQTFLMHDGPEAPGNNYVCRHWHEARRRREAVRG